jgi:glucose/arabinose dehydrogenase
MGMNHAQAVSTALYWLLVFVRLTGPTAAEAATVWTGPPMTFTKTSGADPTQAANQDRITPDVWITRGNLQGLYNAKTEAAFAHFLSPADTEWANGTTANYATLSYTDWNHWAKGVNPGPPSTVGVNAVLHLISDDIYIDIKFTSWAGGGSGGGFSYQRSTPAVVNVPPSVSITNPANGAIFIAPTTATIQAAANDSDGIVTNVQFFDGATSLGNATSSPYGITANLALGPHTLTAVASDNLGATTTSDPITVSVISNTPPSVSITSPTNGTSLTAPATVIIAATTSDLDGNVTNVAFFDGTDSIGHVANSPYSILASLAVGTHTLTATVSDNLGTTTTSATVTVAVASNGPPNQPAFTGILLANTAAIAPALSITNGSFQFTWQGDANARFDLLFSRGLGSNDLWQLAQANIAGAASGSNSLADPPYLASPGYTPNTNLFYRLRALPPQAPGLAVGLQVIVTNLVSPTALTHAHDGSGRLFIADQIGQVRVVDVGGNLLPTPYLDISSRLVTLIPAYDERGLLGLAFHPGYATNGRFFVYYAAPPPNTNWDNMTVLSEFRVSVTDTNQADSASERVLLTINQPEPNHEGAAVVFGPDGYLYLGPGDGGGAGDQHGVNGNAQSLTNLLGKILRIDVDSGSPYGIPADNPFVNVPGAKPEIYAYGLRNPARFSFDRGGTHQGLVADVGENFYEELDVLRKGANYGWRILEGNHAYDPGLATTLGVNIPSLEFPLFEYAHGPSGIAIIGGFMYRGANYPALAGKYVFGDFSTSIAVPDGQLYYLNETRPGIWERFGFQVWPGSGRLGRYVKGFGEDEAGEVYLLSSGAPGPAGNTGDVRRLFRP